MMYVILPYHPSPVRKRASVGLYMTTTETSLDLDHGLARLGYSAFRPGQREAIDTLLRVGRLLLIAPTGGGKSLVYQLPASLLPGTTLVISPLISLMQDQVSAMEARGIAATFLASTLDPDTLRQRMAKMARGHYQLVYVSPERLSFPGFQDVLDDITCPLVVIDEAHCISEWGHDFRPEYRQIGLLLPQLPDARVLACTATATPIVRDEILEQLGLSGDTPQLVHGFARPNLALRAREVSGKHERASHVDAVLSEALGAPGSNRGTAIIYAPTRKATEEEANRLAHQGWRTAGYHAGMTGTVRDRVQREFFNGALECIVATNAFGMGIDRADVRVVVHLAPPSSIEAYYQEVGRAGRDGKDAIGLLLMTPNDMPLRRYLIERGTDGRAPDPAVIQHKWNMFLELMRWAEGGSCRHDAILRYFSDEGETLHGCGRCDVCTQLADEGEQNPEQVAIIVRKALSAVARVNGRFGLQVAAKLLSGDEDPRLTHSGLSNTTTYGILSDHSESWLTRLLRRCVTAGWVDFIGQDRPTVMLTEEGHEVMRALRPARLLLPPKHIKISAPKPATRRRQVVPEQEELDATGYELFEALRRHRLELARAGHVPPYIIASDRTLRDLAHLRPRTLDDLKLAHGIGPVKAARYGPSFLTIISAHQ